MRKKKSKLSPEKPHVQYQNSQKKKKAFKGFFNNSHMLLAPLSIYI